MQFLENRGYTGVSSGVSDNSSSTVYIHCNLHRLNLERRLQSELQWSR